MSKLFEAKDFKPHLNSEFELIHSELGKILIQLVELEEWDNNTTSGFLLLFKGPKNKVMPQDTLKMNHKVIGEFELFIGPVMYHKQDGVYYEAIINRLKNNLKGEKK